jgi:hypothetical protein
MLMEETRTLRCKSEERGGNRVLEYSLSRLHFPPESFRDSRVR